MKINAWTLGVFAALMLLPATTYAGSPTGKKAPEITLREWITNNHPDVKNLAGKVYVVDFWATWCHPCVEGIPHLIKLTDKYAGKVDFIALSQDKSADVVRKFVREKRINYHVAIDNGTTDWFGVTGYPTVAVVNHLGIIAWQGFPWKPEFEKAIAKAVADAPPPLLAGADLGPYKQHADALWGGKNFAAAYNKIRADMSKLNKPPTAAAAKIIIATIDKNILLKIRQAELLAASDPTSAFCLYTEIIEKYDGIEVVKPAKIAYLKMRTAIETPKPLLTAQIDTPADN